MPDFLLVGGEVTRKLNPTSLLVPTSLRSQQVVTIFHLGGVCRPCKATQRFESDCSVYPWRTN